MPKQIGMKKRKTFRNLLLLIFTLSFAIDILAQVDSSSTTQNDSLLALEKSDYRAYISTEYNNKLEEHKEKIIQKNRDLRICGRDIDNLKKMITDSKNKETRASIANQIKKLELKESKIKSEIQVIQKAVRLLESNRNATDPVKLTTLNKLNTIETELILLNEKFDSETYEMEVSNVNVDAQNVYLNPPDQECQLVFNGVDKQTKKKTKATDKAFLFGYTHPNLKPHFKENHFLSCQSQVVKIENKYYWWLYFTIASKDAIRSYGYIEKDSPLKIQLLNKEIFYVSNAQNSIGSLEPYTGNVLYEVVLPLDRPGVRDLMKSEIDRIGMMWSSGYEEYQVYQVDVVMRQIECLKNN